MIPRLASSLGAVLAALTVSSALSVAEPPQASGDVIFSGNTKACTFAFDWRKGMIFVPVRINGSRQLSFVLDTGSSRILIDRGLAADLGFKATGKGSVQGAGAGRIPVEFIPDAKLQFPGVEGSGFELSTADLRPLKQSLGVAVDGILGYEIFRRMVVTVDYESKKLTLTSPEAFRPNEAAQQLPLELKNKWPYVKAELVLPGQVTVQDSFLVDSGSSDAVDHPIIMNLQSRIASKSGVGIGSPVEGATARAESIRLGRYTLENPIVGCCGATDATSKLIGSEVLRRFTVTFDYPASRIFIAPNSFFGDGSLSVPNAGDDQ